MIITCDPQLAQEQYSYSLSQRKIVDHYSKCYLYSQVI